MPIALAVLLTLAVPTASPRPFALRVVDDQTGRGVPLIELRTVHGIRLWTDSNGLAAFAEPGLMGRDVFFHVSGHGYEFPKDGFGYRGKIVRVTEGGSVTLKIRRVNLAERLYRVTGGGIYRDSVLLGTKTPLKEPVLNGQVVGCDSVMSVPYRGKLYWFWGDTLRPGYPLGNFHVPGATSEMPGRGGLDPSLGVDLHYFLDAKGFAKETMRMPGKGPTWMTALAALPDARGHERLCAAYVKVEPPLKIYARGLAVFDDDEQRFKHHAAVSMGAPAFPSGHMYRRGEHVYFTNPFPQTRVRATMRDFLNPEAYETFTCLTDAKQLDRDAKGRLRYTWRTKAPALSPQAEAKMLAKGQLKPGEARWQLRDRDTGKSVIAHNGSVNWNDYRKRWVMIAVQIGGRSLLGEVWYAEADAPTGPWGYAVKVVTHDRYSFYNPRQHPNFDADGGRRIYFEGTYTQTFSGNTDATPRYEYNQVMYRLDLADPRTALPAAIYAREGGAAFTTTAPAQGMPAFFAPDQPLPGTVPVIADKNGLRLGRPGEAGALFYALPPDSAKPPAPAVPLYEHRARGGAGRLYAVGATHTIPGHDRASQPLCLVWRRFE